jgi:alkane 1-monooxygenase
VLPAVVALLALALPLAADPARAAAERLGAVLSTGVVCGAIGIVAAHEWIHRPRRIERAQGWLLLALVGWTHYPIEHVLGHHRTAATPEDPATAPRGMGLWRFLPRVMAGEIRGAWRLEGERLRRRGARAGGWHDRRTLGLALTAAIHLATLARWGAAGWISLIAIGLVAVILLQSVQYVEHYGLERAPRPGGGWMPQTAAHSWDSEHAVAKALLFRLPRHADHHLHASRPYPELEARPESPQLPGGYAQMILLAMVPPLWRRAMDRRIPHAAAATA